MNGRTERLSKSRVDRAGEVLRQLVLNQPVDPFEVRRAFGDADTFRREWSIRPYPLTGVNMGLRSMVRTVLGGHAEVSQRHKRFQRMVDKLVRQRHMRLTQMEDIGGCRVVAAGHHEVDLMRDRIRMNWGPDIRSEQDYVANPKPDGYRAIHVIVKRADHLVEIQLRTQRQHWWAKSVEVLESLGGGPLRGDSDDFSAMETLRTMSDLLARVDRDDTPTDAELQAANRRWQELMQRLRS